MTDPTARPWPRRRLLGAALVMVAPACGSAGPAAGGSGVRGVTDVDIGCAPSPDATPCPRRPLKARLRFVPRDHNRRTVEVRTGADGRFRVQLPPGRYDVVPDNLIGAAYPRADRTMVEVRGNKFTALTVMFDSGVR